MKQFILFSGETYYAAGGAWDIVGSFDTLDEAMAAGANEFEYGNDWWHVYDQEQEKILAKSPTQAHS